jgi:hypothetical protein
MRVPAAADSAAPQFAPEALLEADWRRSEPEVVLPLLDGDRRARELGYAALGRDGPA